MDEALEQEFEQELEQAFEEELEQEREENQEQAPIATSFGTVTDRLSEIADIMEDESMPLDDALDLLEEAVALGMQASSLLETDMNERDVAEEEDSDVVSSDPVIPRDPSTIPNESEETHESSGGED